MERNRFRLITLIGDIIILTVSFLFIVSTKPSSFAEYIPSHAPFFISLAVIWIISLACKTERCTRVRL
ncbi:MAG: hypothetical protein U0T33_11910 [Bacteroidales bacterium]